jgi:hypothetical protein
MQLMTRHKHTGRARALFAALLLGLMPISASTQEDVVDLRLSADELRQLVGPIALYPDDLLGIVLNASAYPLQIVAAGRFLEDVQDNPDRAPDPAWDESVVALLNYPDIVELLNDDLEWTESLGFAFVEQEDDLFEAVQAFRKQVYAAGNLKSDDRQKVIVDDYVIRIEPAEPDVIYVPTYEPARVVVYQPYPAYYYYPRPYPVYYYPYPAHHTFAAGFFWGVTTVFLIDWLDHGLHVHYHGHYGHPYYGHSYYPARHYYHVAYRPARHARYSRHHYRHKRHYARRHNREDYRDGDGYRPDRRTQHRRYDGSRDGGYRDGDDGRRQLADGDGRQRDGRTGERRRRDGNVTADRRDGPRGQIRQDNGGLRSGASGSRQLVANNSNGRRDRSGTGPNQRNRRDAAVNRPDSRSRWQQSVTRQRLAIEQRRGANQRSSNREYAVDGSGRAGRFDWQAGQRQANRQTTATNGAGGNRAESRQRTVRNSIQNRRPATIQRSRTQQTRSTASTSPRGSAIRAPQARQRVANNPGRRAAPQQQRRAQSQQRTANRATGSNASVRQSAPRAVRNARSLGNTRSGVSRGFSGGGQARGGRR